MDLTEGVIWKQVLVFAIPLLGSSLIQQLYNTADAFIVGRYVGDSALAAVGGSASSITNLITEYYRNSFIHSDISIYTNLNRWIID